MEVKRWMQKVESKIKKIQKMNELLQTEIHKLRRSIDYFLDNFDPNKN